MENEEIWKDIDGYDGIYQVSNLGRIKSLERFSLQNHLLPERIINGFTNDHGYLVVDLYKDGERKRYYVHRVVAKAFVPNPRELDEVDHIDRNTSNCNADNLRWCTHSENYENINTKEVARISNSKYNISVLKDGILLGEFIGYCDLERRSKDLFGFTMWHTIARKVAFGKISNYNGYDIAVKPI